MSDADPYLGSHKAHVGIVLSVPTSVPKRGPTDHHLDIGYAGRRREITIYFPHSPDEGVNRLAPTAASRSRE